MPCGCAFLPRWPREIRGRFHHGIRILIPLTMITSAGLSNLLLVNSLMSLAAVLYFILTSVSANGAHEVT